MQNRCDASSFDKIYATPAKLQPLLKSAGGDDQLNVTGSPLKDDIGDVVIEDDSMLPQQMIVKPWKPEEEYHSGIAVEKARSIICSPQDFQLGPDMKICCGSIWFLCTVTETNKVMLLQYEFTTNVREFSRGIIEYKGIVNMNDLNSSQSLLKSHLNLMLGGGKICPVETYIENTYNIKNNMTICCSWATTASLPLLIDLSLCDVTLKQSFYLSNGSVITEMFLNQLKILMSIRDDILAYKEIENSDVVREPVYRCGM